MTAPLRSSTLTLLLAITAGACAPSPGDSPNGDAVGSNPAAESPASQDDPAPADLSPRRYGYRILHTYPHDTKAYTQGLLWDDGYLIETTGRTGESFLRKVELETGRVVRSTKLPGAEFGEGLAKWKGIYLQLTWKDGQAIAWDAKTFSELYRFEYEGEGWGLVTVDDKLVMSDGSSQLQLRDPRTFELLADRPRIDVQAYFARDKRWVSVPDLNELEYIDGEVWANIYQSELIARIDLESGHVTGYIDFSGLLAKQGVSDPRQDVLNGIAYDPETGRIFITGKYWPNLYEIEVFPLED